MDKEDEKELEEIVNNPKAPDKAKFECEIMLLFDKYDPVHPKVNLNIVEFLGIIDKHKSALFHHYMLAMDKLCDGMPLWEKT